VQRLVRQDKMDHHCRRISTQVEAAQAAQETQLVTQGAAETVGYMAAAAAAAVAAAGFPAQEDKRIRPAKAAMERRELLL
jgi:hypothetical protein